MSKNRKLDILGIVVFTTLLAFSVGLQAAQPFSGTTKTLGDDFIEIEDINATNDWYRGTTNLTDRLLGDWGSTDLTTTGSVDTADLNFTSEFYYNDVNFTEYVENQTVPIYSAIIGQRSELSHYDWYFYSDGSGDEVTWSSLITYVAALPENNVVIIVEPYDYEYDDHIDLDSLSAKDVTITAYGSYHKLADGRPDTQSSDWTYHCIVFIANGVTNFRLYGGEWDGNKVAQTKVNYTHTDAVIYIQGNMNNVRIEDVEVHDALRMNIFIDPVSGLAYDVHVINCVSYETGYNLISFQTGSGTFRDSSIRGCTVWSCGDIGLDLETWDGGTLQNIGIENNFVNVSYAESGGSSATYFGIRAERGCTDIHIRGNTVITRNKGISTHIASGSRIFIEDNDIRFGAEVDADSKAIIVNRPDCTVERNKIYLPDEEIVAIHIGVSVASNRTHVKNNQIEAVGSVNNSHGIRIGSNSEDVVVAENHIIGLDVAITSLAGTVNTVIRDNTLEDCDTDINDLGTDTRRTNNIIDGVWAEKTENSGTQTCADNEDIAHGLDGTPTFVSVTPMNDTYDGEAVFATVDWSNVDSTNIQVGLYWWNGTAISDDIILVAWKAEYDP